MPRVPIEIPIGGLSEIASFSGQPRRTTREMTNWRNLDARTGRIRGASRSGYSKFASAQVSGSSRIQDLQSVVFDDRRQTWAVSNPATVEWGAPDSVASDIEAVHTDARGDVYYVDPNLGGTGSQGVVKLNADGVELTRFTIDIDQTGGHAHRVNAIASDPEGNVYLGDTIPTSLVTALELTRIWRYQRQIDGSYRLQWTILGEAFTTQLRIYAGRLYALRVDHDVAPQTSRIEIYDGLNSTTAPPIAQTIDLTSMDLFGDGVTRVVALDLAIREKGAIEIVVCGMDYFGDLATKTRFLAKYSAGGLKIWSFKGADAGAHSPGTGAIGVSCAVDAEFNIYSYGPTTTTDLVKLRRIVDNGATAATVGAGTWSVNAADTPEAYKRIASDQFSNVHVGWSPGAGAFPYYELYDLTGAVLSQLVAGGVGQNTFSVALPPRVPNWLDADPQIPEFVYIAGQDTLSTVEKIRLMSITNTSGSARSMTVLAVAGGNVMKVPPGGAPTMPTGAGSLAQPELDPSAPYIMGFELFGKVFWTDKKNLRYYDPVLDEVLEWKSRTSGSIPTKCSIASTFRGRALLARPSEDAHNWFLSAKDNPFDFDFFPSVLTPTSAVAGNNSNAGRCPDIINTFIPWSDDLGFFGCDHSIWRMTGDPMDEGRIDLVSDVTGIAFGYSWAKDENGMMYAFGSRGGVFRMAPDGLPERISADWIERRLSDIDLTTRNAMLEWDQRRESLEVFIVNQGTGTLVDSYVWERQTQAWSVQSWADATRQPTATLVIDGDSPDDRKLLLGCEDGYVRMVDEDASDDDGIAIDWRVLMGPYSLDAEEKALLFNQFAFTLADDQSGCKLELIPSEFPDVLGDAVYRTRLVAGRNETIFRRTRASYFFIRLQNRKLGESTAFETGSMMVEQAGGRAPMGV